MIKQDKKAEGVIPLTGAHMDENRKGDKENVFHVVTFIGKDCVFEADNAVLKAEWLKDLKAAINDANKP